MKGKIFISFRLKEFVFGFAAVVLCVICVCMFDYNYLATAAVPEEPEARHSIIIDPGHGDFDGGAQSKSGIIEKDINLQISLKLRDMLEISGFDTIMIRDDDEVLSDEKAVTIREKKSTDLKNRLKVLNEHPDALFISIHQNYFTESKYTGTQVFYSKNNPESQRLAQHIQESVASGLQHENNREIKQSGSEIYLLNQAENTAVMVECGFLSNENECSKLSEETYRNKLSLIMYSSVMSFLKE